MGGSPPPPPLRKLASILDYGRLGQIHARYTPRNFAKLETPFREETP